jgi:hypothetical protein
MNIFDAAERISILFSTDFGFFPSSLWSGCELDSTRGTGGRGDSIAPPDVRSISATEGEGGVAECSGRGGVHARCEGSLASCVEGFDELALLESLDIRGGSGGGATVLRATALEGTPLGVVIRGTGLASASTLRIAMSRSILAIAGEGSDCSFARSCSYNFLRASGVSPETASDNNT